MKSFITIVICFIGLFGFSQKELHVFPENHSTTPGTKHGDGSLGKPFDLQTALELTTDKVNGGDIIWVHEGTYNGRFVSTISSTDDKLITISNYKGGKVVINGNVPSTRNAVLEVRGKRVKFENLEITFIGKFLRDEKNENFKPVLGINHLGGKECEFINLKIHNNPGSGIGSWKKAGGSKIIGCTIFNNGFFGKKRGRGVGIYVQNQSEAIRVIRDNVIFNNYYKGIEVWSANKNAKSAYVKNIDIDNNIVFNNGLPSGRLFDNLIIGTDDRKGANIARNINVRGNLFYHNTDIKNSQINGDAPALTLGFSKKAPLEDIVIEGNHIIGRNNAMRLLHAKSLTFKNNVVYSGYVYVDPTYQARQSQWDFSSNRYFTKKKKAFRFGKPGFHDLDGWNTNITSDANSEWKHLKDFSTRNVLSIKRHQNNNNTFTLAIFNKDGNNVMVDFSEYGDIKNGSTFKIKNIETNAIITSGILKNNQIEIPIGTYNNTHDNFGVFFIEFESPKIETKRKTALGKFFRWLGF
ncbi:right-handed parallel beta-helix repeat-containing protein [Winogradskyella sp. 3972H.M.0a.05]|uniref:right-handed parallel beta-helix repeat-containing protein n=1 Tax=Winogradskyella sp. 3972H.M.0a.05 TaxID=2950277 RepID=UPI00339A7FA1